MILHILQVQVGIMAQMAIFGSTQPVQLALLISRAATCWCLRDRWGFPKIGGTILGVPVTRTIVFWGSILGSSLFCETTRWGVDTSSNPLGSVYPYDGTYIHSPTPPTVGHQPCGNQKQSTGNERQLLETKTASK